MQAGQAVQHCFVFKRCRHCRKKHRLWCDGCAGCATLLQEAPFMRRRWLCRLCSTTDDGYAGCAEGIEPSDAMTTMTCLFVLACFCLPLSVEPFLCPLVCSSCFAHLLLRASDVPAPQMSKSPLSLLAGYRLTRTWRSCAAAYQSCLYSSMICLGVFSI